MSLIIAVIVALIVFTIVVAIGARSGADGQDSRQKAVLRRIYHDSDLEARKLEDVALLRRDVTTDITNPVLLSIVKLAPVRHMYELILRAGFYGRVRKVVVAAFVIFVVVTLIMTKTKFAVLAPFVGLIASWFLITKFMKRRVAKRNDKFISNFPDAIDIIVRSVRAGHPLNTALRMIAENSEPPISTEFKQVVDEVAYGRTLIEALNRLATRIDEADLQFFIVVLSVQQETGSNLAEVLTNLSGVIRKRKQLRLKIKAMTSEGRATAWVLGALPVVVFGALMVVAPTYLVPLWTKTAGQIILGSAIALIVTAFVVVKQMVNIEI